MKASLSPFTSISPLDIASAAFIFPATILLSVSRLSVIEAVTQRGLALDGVLYQAPVGPIRVCDVLWGYQKEIRESGQPYYAHLWGFSRDMLGRALKVAGFEYILIGGGHYELRALAHKRRPAEG